MECPVPIALAHRQRIESGSGATSVAVFSIGMDPKIVQASEGHRLRRHRALAGKTKDLQS
jgi:hypothetical protein